MLLTRHLSYFDREDVVRVDQSFLASSPRSLVVLGEAGMGKSTLLDQLRDTPGYLVCPARKLTNAVEPARLFGGNQTLVIDALDEVSANREGDAVDLVLRQLERLGHPRFILSCRVADWRSATAMQGIRDFYDDDPVELYLEPLSRDDADAYLAASLGPDGAETALAHMEQRGLAGLWENPQTLGLVEEVVRSGRLPASKGDLFEQATLLMLHEHRDEKATTPLAEMPQAQALDTVGAAFAALILTGKAALTRKVQAAEDEILLRDLIELPGAGRLADTLGARVFVSRADRFTYAHRAIGEFLGARWLAARADTPRMRRRLVQLFTHQDLVPTSLRGLHAWLAWHSPALATGVIESDPMGVVEYGDADRLTEPQGRAMIGALHRLSKADPRFRAWTEYRASGLVQPALLPEVAEILTAPGVEFGLRMMILQALKGSNLISRLTPILLKILKDPKAAFATRSEAGERLAALDEPIDWPSLIDGLIVEESTSSIRLASELMDTVGFAVFSDAQILGTALAMLPQSERTIGVYYSLQRNLPDDRIDALLDGIATAAMALEDRRAHPGYGSLAELAYGLIARRLPLGPVPPEQLWSWMRPFSSGSGLLRKPSLVIAAALAADAPLRRAIQKLVLLDLPGDRNFWQRSWRLTERSPGLSPSEDDLMALLETLDDSDERWRDIVRQAPHSATQGIAIRAEAARFIRGDADAAAWLASLENPPEPEWEVKERERRLARERKRDEDWARHRAQFSAAIADIRKGQYGYIIDPAKAYLKLFVDMGDSADDGPGRIREWLGTEVADASLEGFEAFLTAQPPKPTAQEMAESFAQSRRWEAGFIITAALAERQRTGRGFADLPDERLMAGLFELRHTRSDDHAGMPDLEPSLVKALRDRGVWEATQRLHFEPQLANRRTHVDGLYAFMRDELDASLATALAIEWLDRFPDLPAETEAELANHLLTSEDGAKALSSRVAARRRAAVADVDRRGLWDAVGLLLIFEETQQALEAAGAVDPNLFWHLRARQAGRRGERARFPLKTNQLEWIIQTFRGDFPLSHRPEGVTSGDTNAWDASEYMLALIDRIGADASAEAGDALARLMAVEDGYSDRIRSVTAEQKRNRMEAGWTAPDLATVASALSDAPPTTGAQMQAVILEELAVVQAKVRSSDRDWYKNFFHNLRPKTEDECRDAILQVLETPPFQIQAIPEGHMADDKRADILFLLGDRVVPVEIKGQWHPRLWSAADEQLDRLYVADWRAERGIFIVLWFGPGSPKPITRAPHGPTPDTPEGLKAALEADSATVRDGRTEIVVLDLTRPG